MKTKILSRAIFIVFWAVAFSQTVLCQNYSLNWTLGQAEVIDSRTIRFSVVCDLDPPLATEYASCSIYQLPDINGFNYQEQYIYPTNELWLIDNNQMVTVQLQRPFPYGGLTVYFQGSKGNGFYFGETDNLFTFEIDREPKYENLNVSMIGPWTLIFSVKNSHRLTSTTYASWSIDGGESGTINPADLENLDNGYPITITLQTPIEYGEYTFHFTGAHLWDNGEQFENTVQINFVATYGYAINSIKSQTVLYPTIDQLPVGSTDAQIETFLNTLRANNKLKEAIAYSNGLGKSIQSVVIKASPTQKDVVSHVEYDEYGLQTTSYAPYTSSTNEGAYRVDAKDKQSDFYEASNIDHPADVAATGYPYAKTIVEKSPLLRTLEQGAVGSDWQPDAVPKHTVRTEYGANIADEVLRFDVHRTSGALTQNGYYGAGQIFITQVTNEDNKTSVVYKDKSGKEILKESLLDNNWVQTYYVYDIFGNLRFIIPPEAIHEMGAGAWLDALRTKWVTQYNYDSYNRQIEKYAPEEEVVTTVYDYLGRVVLRQDGDFRANHDWLFTKYDKYSRVIMTGVYHDTNTPALDRQGMQAYADALTNVDHLYETRTAEPVVGYTLTNAFPPIAQSEIWMITYYDDYDFDNDKIADAQILPETEFSAADHDTASYPNYKVTGFEQFNRLQDKVTKVKIQQLNPSVQSVQWLETVVFYDKYGRVIQTQSTNHLSGMDIVSTQYEFAGKALQTKRTHYVDLQ